MEHFLSDLRHEFRRHKLLADRAIMQLDDEEFVRSPAGHVNSVALIVKHMAGNLTSRWTDFLTTDGDKPNRDRDAEFLHSERDTRTSLLESWEHGWTALFQTLDTLAPLDLDRSVSIRGESHRVSQALQRGLSHAAYHVGQILYLVRLWRPDGPWLTIPPGQSQGFRGAYLQEP